MEKDSSFQDVEPQEVVELEHIIQLIDEVLGSLQHAPWAYTKDGVLLDPYVFELVIDGKECEKETPEQLSLLNNSLELRQAFLEHKEKSPFSFLEYEEVKKRNVMELVLMSWEEVSEVLLKEEKGRVLAILRKGTCPWCRWRIPETISDEFLLKFIAFRYGDKVERMKREDEFRRWALNYTTS